ncbi:LPXTG cell wall anchor domain-containing protein [Isoptericola chiayiensis]|uniref:LPXTG cell wall anchor domain-containing protein n=1 Tax=Isoptericola chiayiensis TaxID=579446 RepID=UPI0015529C6C|nr:LPXTG-motif cell wall-anchored protein [Isoptericola chiayiensis]
MRRILASIATSTLALGGLLVATAAPATAHTPEAEATCDSLTVDLQAYQGATVTVRVDGQVVDRDTFHSSYDESFDLDPSREQTWDVEVDAHDGDHHDWDRTGDSDACESSAPEIGTAFYVYPKIDPERPAAWENSGFQTLIATRDGGEFWETLPEEYPGELFDETTLPADVCEGSWGVQQDIVGIHDGFDWADYQHIEFENGGPYFRDLRAYRHDDLSNYLAECSEEPARQVTPDEPAFVESCEADNAVTLPPDSEDVRYHATWNEARTEVTVTAELTEGVEPAPDAVTTWSHTFTREACEPEPEQEPQPEPTVVTPEAPQVTDLCGVENDDLSVPEDTEEVTYTSTDGGILAHAAESTTFGDLPAGYTAVDETTALFAVDESTFTDEPCALVPGDITAVCESEVPYLAYEVSLPQGVEADGDTPLTVTFLNPDGDDYTVTDQPLAGSLLWPGASAQEPLQWPGWERLDDGSYVETDGNYAWTRDGVQVRFEVNPDYSTVVDYPPASSECANPELPDAGTGGVDPIVDAEPVADAGAEELPQTGATVGIVAAVAALLVAAGVTLFVVRRRLRQE